MSKKKQANLNVCLIISKEVDKDMDISEDSKNNYYNYLAWFDKFLKHYSITFTSFNEITSQTFKDYQSFLRNVTDARTKDGKLSVRYINNCVKSLYQRLGTYIVPLGMMERVNLLNITVPVINDKTEDYGIALRDDEIIKLWNYQCENEKEELVRDLFILNCLTGQRISDTQKIGENVDEIMSITTIKLVQQKTDKFVKCGIVFELAKDILKKYNEGIPNLTNNDMNNGIKNIAHKANINSIEYVGRQSGTSNKVTVVDKPRYECISSHTGRRTFITLLKLRGWDSTKIMRYSGHKDTRMVEHYCKLKDSLEYEVFEKTKREHPELILRMVGENEPELPVPAPQLRTEKVEVVETTTPSNGVHTTIVNSIDEAKKVLNYLGADVDDYIEIDNINELLNLIGYYHTVIKMKYGATMYDVKEIFNKYADPKMRKQHLHNLLKKMESEKQV
ncbi:MAG: tyrosine-type recombinase/integrase [Bacteroides sp.]|nr:tyrosine-type recombinase/integrase [Bacteroides sp.]